MLSVCFYWSVECGNDSESPGLVPPPPPLLLFKVPVVWRCAHLESKHGAGAQKYLVVIVPLRLATEHLSSLPSTHPIWAWCAPTAWWQLMIAASPLINCWNDTPAHKQCIILWEWESLQSSIVEAKYAGTFSLCLSLAAGWERAGLLGVQGLEGGGVCLACKFQSRLRYPSRGPANSQN